MQSVFGSSEREKELKRGFIFDVCETRVGLFFFLKYFNYFLVRERLEGDVNMSVCSVVLLVWFISFYFLLILLPLWRREVILRERCKVEFYITVVDALAVKKKESIVDFIYLFILNNYYLFKEIY